jgi:hypothetical protein
MARRPHLKPVGWHSQYEYDGNSRRFGDATDKAPSLLREEVPLAARQAAQGDPPPRTARSYGSPPTSSRPLAGKGNQQLRPGRKNTLRSAPPAPKIPPISFRGTTVLRRLYPLSHCRYSLRAVSTGQLFSVGEAPIRPDQP